MDFLNIQEIFKFFANFYKLFDVVRVIDTEKKQVICSDDNLEGHKSVCYEFWEKDSQCSDCIASRAMSQKDTFMKIEYLKGRAFLVLASPVRLRGEEYIVEIWLKISQKPELQPI
ncbi:hypothetical protein SDC9_153023 [bioreactor metagenome]|uniref:Uncharacterized protein n=1 Tax=bioreactor metagenome TaxID=1076179 RepID=A0A645EWF3_9ZZZZ|nr:hypothetical protein [Lachnospiraceae bacterium]